MAKISQPFKKKIKLILSLFVEEEQQESEEVEKLKSHEIKKRLKSLFFLLKQRDFQLKIQLKS